MQFSSKQFKINLASIILVISTFFIVGFLIHVPKASAVAEDFTQTIPTNILNDGRYGNCVNNGTQFKHYQNVWISNPNDSGNYPDVPIQINDNNPKFFWYNSISAHCNTNIDLNGNIVDRTLQVTRSTVTNASAVIDSTFPAPISGINNTSVDLDYKPSYNFNARWIKQDANTPYHQGFALSNLGTMNPGWHNIDVTITSRIIHVYLNPNNTFRYACVAPGPGWNTATQGPIQPASSLDDPACGLTTRTIRLVVNIVVPFGPIGDINYNDSNCELGAWAFDTEAAFSSQSLQTRLVIDNSLTLFNGTTNQDSSDVNNAYNITGRHRLPTFDMKTRVGIGGHTAQLYARDLPTNAEVLVKTKAFSMNCSVTNSSTPIVPQAATQFDDDESPTVATFTSGISSGANTNGQITRKFYIKRNNGGTDLLIPVGSLNPNPGGNPVSETRSMAAFTYPTVTFANPLSLGLQPGDQICVDVTVTPKSVTVNSLGQVVSTDNTPETRTGCDRLKNKPFVSVYGGDIFAGGGMAGFGTCNKSADISTYSRSGYAGSGVQFAAFAMGQITKSTGQGFNTARLSSSDPLSLAFANTGGVGGNFGGEYCVVDEFQKVASVSAVSATSLNVGSLPSGSSYYRNTSSPITLSGVLANGQKTKIFIDGDVRINGNITYANSTWSSIQQIPSLQVFVRGNIYIESGVGQITGFFSAQKNGASGGTIVTCVIPGTINEYATSQLTASPNGCGQKLVINGAFSANFVRFLRANGSLRNAGAGELTAGGSSGAEVFNFSPAMYLSIPSDRPLPVPTNSKKFDYYTVLPPIL